MLTCDKGGVLCWPVTREMSCVVLACDKGDVLC